MSKGRRIEPDSLWSQDPAARTIQYSRAMCKEKIPKIHRTTVTRQNVFCQLVILVVEGNGALSEVDGYCTYVY